MLVPLSDPVIRTFESKGLNSQSEIPAPWALSKCTLAPTRPTVPTGNNSIQILADDSGDNGVVGRFDDSHHLSRHCHGVVDISDQVGLIGRGLFRLSLRGKGRNKCQIIDVVLKASNFLDSIFHRATSSLCGYGRARSHLDKRPRNSRMSSSCGAKDSFHEGRRR